MFVFSLFFYVKIFYMNIIDKIIYYIKININNIIILKF